MESALVGSVFLWVAVGAAAVATIPRLSRLLGAAAAFGFVSTVFLAWALITNDFSVAYVAETSSLATPWPYRMSALWGGMEGSMLFYAAMTTVVAWVGLRRHPSSRPIGAAIGFGLLVFTATLANPFERLDIPAVDGDGLLALLQHPAMIYHPPILYLGLTTLVVPFALTVAAVVRNEVDLGWARATRRWLLVSWTALTFGMVAGANWAYVELGWGGYWAWDPVENTALMPWLGATAFFHTSRVFERDGRLRRSSVALGSLPFALSVLGIYLTRSGATGSIHSFAEDPIVGRVLLTAAVVAALTVGVLAARSRRGEPWERFGLGRDTWLGVSGALVGVVLLFVTIGSAYPAYVQVFTGRELSVGPGFFVSTVYPIALIIAIALGLALNTRWTGQGIKLSDLGVLIGGAVVAAGVAIAVGPVRWAPIVLLAISAGTALLLIRSLVAKRPRGRGLVPHLAHLGLAMVLIGAGGSSLGDDFSGVMSPGDEVVVAGRTVTLSDIAAGEADRFIFVRATFSVDGSVVEPEIRAYEDQNVPVAEPALLSGPGGDVIVAISTVTSDASAVNASVFVRPMVWWVWAGALVIAIAGLFGLASTTAGAEARRRSAREEPQSTETASGTRAR